MKNDYVKCILDRPSFDSYLHIYLYVYIYYDIKKCI